MNLPEHLLILREKHGLKQKELAQEIGIGVHTYQRYEYGHREPPLATLIALADYYDLTLDELVCRERNGHV